MPRWDYGRPHVVADWDARYEQLKHASRAYQASGRLGWDDRLKMFHISGPVDIEGTTYAWIYHTYNQCRLAALMGSVGYRLDHIPRAQHVNTPTHEQQPRPPPPQVQPGPAVDPPVDNTGGGSSGWYT